MTRPTPSASKEEKEVQMTDAKLYLAFMIASVFFSCLTGLLIAMGHLCNRRTGLHLCMFFPMQH